MARDRELDDLAFDEWWKRYPRKVNKAGARRCWHARLKEGATRDELGRALDGYVAHLNRNRTELRYVMHGTTFLSGRDRRWRDFLRDEQPGDQRRSEQLPPKASRSW